MTRIQATQRKEILKTQREQTKKDIEELDKLNNYEVRETLKLKKINLLNKLNFIGFKIEQMSDIENNPEKYIDLDDYSDPSIHHGVK